MLLFVSDTHWLHKNIIEYSKRPFKNVDEMTEALIKNWNTKVGPDDDVFHHGDFMFGNPSGWKEILYRLNGRIHLLAGNHDYKFVKQSYVINRMEWIKERHELWVPDEDAPKGKQLIVMSHYAHHVWNQSHRGAWHTFGHSHGSLDEWSRDRLAIDVGVDSEHTNYSPISYDEVKAIMSKKSIKFVDHHNSYTNP